MTERTFTEDEIRERDTYADAAFRWWYQARQNNIAAWAHLRNFERALQESDNLTRERDEWKARCMTVESSEEDAQQAAAKFKRRAEAAEQRATEAELRALNMADDRPIQVSAANAETNDDLRNENKQLREALNYATQDMDHEDIAIVEQIAHGLWRWYDGAVSDDLRRENARLEQMIHAINIEGARVHDRNGEFKAAVRDIIFPVAAGLQTTEAKTETCRWEAVNEPDDQTWHIQCGRNVVFRDDDVAGPFEYCPYCSKPIEIVSEEVDE